MHPSQSDMVRFLGGVLPESGAERMYTHLDACGPCRERYEALRTLREDFEGSWTEFLAELAHRRAVGWEAGHPTSLLHVRGLLEGARKLATLASEAAVAAGERFGLGTSLRPAYGGVGDPGEATMKLQRDASLLLGQDATEEALATLERVAAVHPDSAASSLAELTVDGVNVGHVVIDARRRSLSLLLQNDFLSKNAVRASARILVQPGPPGGEVADKSKPLQAVPGAAYHLAEFENLGDGVVEVTLELHPR